MDTGPRPLAVTRRARLVRRWRLDRNPLRRTSDRVESVVVIALVVAFLFGAPLAARASGTWAQAAAQRAELAQQASRRQVTAVVLTAATAPDVGYWDPAEVTQARWTAPDGAVVTSELPVTIGTTVGATLRVWTTLDGQLVSHPMTEAQVTSMTQLGTVTGVAGLAVLLALAGGLTHWSLCRRRMAAWDTGWQATGPRWNTRT